MSTQNVNVARFARNVEWDFFYDFQTPWWSSTKSGTQQRSTKLTEDLKLDRKLHWLQYLIKVYDFEPKMHFEAKKENFVIKMYWKNSLPPPFSKDKWRGKAESRPEYICISKTFYRILPSAFSSHSVSKVHFLFKNYKFLKSLENGQFLFLCQKNCLFLAVKY